MNEDTILPQIINAKYDEGYNGIVYVNEMFTLRTFTVQNSTDGEIGVWEDIMSAPKWKDFVAMCRHIVNENFVPEEKDLIMEYRATINRMNEISTKLAQEHDISTNVNATRIAHSYSAKTGDQLEYAYLNVSFRKFM